jgi:hypothetical protein
MRLLRLHPPLMMTAAAMAVLVAIGTAGVLLDDRMLVGVPIWLKPLKFAISIAVYLVTLAWLLSLLTRRRRIGRWLGTVIAVGMLVEMVIIVGQVARGRQSHFNVAAPLDAALYSTMGVTVVVVWLATAGIGVLLLRERISDRPAALAIRSGLIVAVAGMGVGFLMTSPSAGQRAQMQAGAPAPLVGAHSIGVADGGAGLPLVNWSSTGGDLRVGHFIGMHALQALPLAALALTLGARRFRRLRDERVRVRLVAVVAAAYAGLTLLVTWQALRGQSLAAPDGPTLAAAVALLSATAGGVLWALGRATSGERSATTFAEPLPNADATGRAVAL